MKFKTNKKTLNMYDNDTLKWEYEGKKYCLRIQSENYPCDPREDDVPLTTMACWHPHYNLGDDTDCKTPEEFWLKLVKKYVSYEEVLNAALENKLKGSVVKQSDEDDNLFDIYEKVYAYRSKDYNEELEYSGVGNVETAQVLLDEDFLTLGDMMLLMEPYAEWMPLWLYDHSGISMSCGARVYPYNDHWDSSEIGWILIPKDVTMKELVEYVLDENGEPIKIEHKHENALSTWSYKTRPLTEETWRERAREVLEGEVEVYDQYLTGDVYGCSLYEADIPEDDSEPDWEEIDSCWGFYGSDILENGIEDNIGYGFSEAIETGEYTTGKAEAHTVTYYTF